MTINKDEAIELAQHLRAEHASESWCWDSLLEAASMIEALAATSHIAHDAAKFEGRSRHENGMWLEWESIDAATEAEAKQWANDRHQCEWRIAPDAAAIQAESNAVAYEVLGLILATTTDPETAKIAADNRAQFSPAIAPEASELPPKPRSQADGDRTTDYHGRLFKYTDEQLDDYARAAIAMHKAAAGQHLINTGALRQFCHNDGSEGFVFAYDKEITDRIFASLAAAEPVPTSYEAVGWFVETNHSDGSATISTVRPGVSDSFQLYRRATPIAASEAVGVGGLLEAAQGLMSLVTRAPSHTKLMKYGDPVYAKVFRKWQAAIDAATKPAASYKELFLDWWLTDMDNSEFFNRTAKLLGIVNEDMDRPLPPGRNPPAPASQSASEAVGVPQVAFTDLALGARFRYMEGDQVYVLLDRSGLGRVAHHVPSGIKDALQGTYSAFDSSDERIRAVVRVLPDAAPAAPIDAKPDGPLINEGTKTDAGVRDRSIADTVWNDALEEAALICDGVNNHDNPMTAGDCADAIRELKSSPQAPNQGEKA